MSITRDAIDAYISRPMSDTDVLRLIDTHIDTASSGSGIARTKVRGTGTSVAAVIDYLSAMDGDVERTADAFNLEIVQVLSAIFFYWNHQEIIDAEITVRHSYFKDS